MYDMSPLAGISLFESIQSSYLFLECQAGDSTSPYSPMHNDIWSLGIIYSISLLDATLENPQRQTTPPTEHI